MSGRLLVVGEALVDIVVDASGGRSEHVGGSPANVAVGLARLGHEVDFACSIGRDERGSRIADQLSTHGVVVLPASFGDGPTSSALARLDGTGAATYEFDLRWDLPAMAVPTATSHLHTGSIAAILAPGADAVLALVRSARDQATISYDPNIRPGIMGDLTAVRARVETLVALSDVVKASEDDLALLYPDRTVDEVTAHWVALGAQLAVVTLGSAGATFRTASDPTTGTAPTRASHVVDTVGAGDSFMAGLLSGLTSSGLLGGPDARALLARATLEDVGPAIDRGLSTSAVTVGRAGAYAPSLDEL